MAKTATDFSCKNQREYDAGVIDAYYEEIARLNVEIKKLKHRLQKKIKNI